MAFPANSTLGVGYFKWGAYDVVPIYDGTSVWDVSAPSVSQLPPAVTSILDGIRDATLTASQIAQQGLQAVQGKTLTVPQTITNYESIVIEGSGSGEGSGEGSGSVDLSGVEGILGSILAALGVTGPLGVLLNGVIDGVAAVPSGILNGLAGMIFDANVASLSPQAIGQFDTLFNQYVGAIPRFLTDNLIPPITAIPQAIGDLVIPPISAIPQAIGDLVIPPITAIPRAIGDLIIPPISAIPTWLGENLLPPITGIGTLLQDLPGIIQGVPQAILDGIGSIPLTLDLDLSDIISGIGALPASIAASVSAALGLDWFIEQAEELDDRLELPDTTALVLPSATWSDLTGAGETLVALSPLGPVHDAIDGVFDIFSGSGGSSGPPRYELQLPRPDGGAWVFVVDFAIFDGQFVAICHGVFYIMFGFWFVGFMQRSKQRFDDLAVSIKQTWG